MKHKVFKKDGKSINYRVLNLDDLLDPRRFYLPVSVNWKTFFNVKKESNNERHGRKMAKMLVNIFLKELKNDLIYKNDTFIFPEKGFGYFYVGDKSKENIDNFTYNFDTEGKVFGPRIFINNEHTKRSKKLYKMRFTQIGRRQVREQIAKKHYYA